MYFITKLTVLFKYLIWLVSYRNTIISIFIEYLFNDELFTSRNVNTLK